MEELNKYIVHEDQKIRDAIRKMDKGGIGFIVCISQNDEVIGVISNGDFRRAILQGVSLSENISKITNRKFRYLKKNYAEEDVVELFSNETIQHIPVLENGKLIEIITEEHYYGIKKKINQEHSINIPVVIMSGGKGTRLEPFTRILPKALIPLGDKTMIEVIISEYEKYGMNKFYISVNVFCKTFFHKNAKRFS